jgi:hypothetical protein
MSLQNVARRASAPAFGDVLRLTATFRQPFEIRTDRLATFWRLAA